ncbi:hypothetical protein Y032_0041g479 [Ancylostoma ceylanicum]|uniref:Uncharacterized protein n=1 Tax=Ancylostoma ceylanicum TaxID=53326 RepID=A0A016UGM9_9BILA|nr:hypothetical protein Y032_0041g479 [Ancylostoma ceylanicum]
MAVAFLWPRKARSATAPLKQESSPVQQIMEIFLIVSYFFYHYLTANVMNNYPENLDPPMRRRFHRERRGRAACFSRPPKGHRYRRPLYSRRHKLN